MGIPWMEKYKGKKHSKWAGGRITTQLGYVLRYAPEHPNKNKMGKGYVLEHRLVMEKKIGRYLKKNEVVHHLNGIKNDNRLKNLVLITASEHTTLHKTGLDPSPKTRAKHAENFKKLRRDIKTGRIIGKKII